MTRRNFDDRYDDVWRAAATYMGARKNNIHVPLSFAFAARLVEAYPEADADVVMLGILLHDIGWHSIDMAEIMGKVFGRRAMKSDTVVFHEKEGARLARDILKKQGWPEATIAAVSAIIDGHDTRPAPLSLEDRLVRDSDKLWRFTVTGLAVVSDWFKQTPRQYVDWLGMLVNEMETEVGRLLAEEEMRETIAALVIDLIEPRPETTSAARPSAEFTSEDRDTRSNTKDMR